MVTMFRVSIEAIIRLQPEMVKLELFIFLLYLSPGRAVMLEISKLDVKKYTCMAINIIVRKIFKESPLVLHPNANIQSTLSVFQH